MHPYTSILSLLAVCLLLLSLTSCSSETNEGANTAPAENAITTQSHEVNPPPSPTTPPPGSAGSGGVQSPGTGANPESPGAVITSNDPDGNQAVEARPDDGRTTLADFQPTPQDDDSTSVSSAERTALQTANQQLSIALYRACTTATPPRNCAFAPLPIAESLAMLALGAAGETHTALRDVLRTELPFSRFQTALHATLADLRQAIRTAVSTTPRRSGGRDTASRMRTLPTSSPASFCRSCRDIMPRP